MTLPDITPTATAANITKAMQWTVILLTAAYVILLILEPRLGPWDEFVFLPTLQSGIPLPFTQSDNYPYVNFNALGRFFPLAFQEFNLIGIYLSNNPFWYFFAIAMQLVVLVLLFNVLVKKFIVDDALRYFGLIVLIISPRVCNQFF